MKILVICGAGASSTFVALRLRRALLGGEHAAEITAGSVETIPVDLGPSDLVLLGPHLADRQDDVVRAVAPARVSVLPDDVYADRDGSRTAALVSDILSPTSEGRT